MENYCKSLPKIELHAHLNGSVNKTTLQLLYANKQKSSENIDRMDLCIGDDDTRTLTECLAMFDCIYQIVDTPEIIKFITKSVIKDFHDDGVIYLEIRTTPRAVDNKMTKLQYLEAVISAIKELEYLNIKVKLLISLNRRRSLEPVENVDLAIKFKHLYPDIVCGIDVSGDPDHGSWFEDVMIKARNAGLNIAMHCAEIPNIEEIKDILKFKPDRIGHGTCIHEKCLGSEDIWQMLINSRIPVECCLTSNLKTMTVKKYEEHHFKYLYEANHPVIICTDDKGVFATTLSQEYMITSQFFNLDYKDLFKLSYDAIKYTFTSEKEKKILEKQLHKWKEDNQNSF